MYVILSARGNEGKERKKATVQSPPKAFKHDQGNKNESSWGDKKRRRHRSLCYGSHNIDKQGLQPLTTRTFLEHTVFANFGKLKRAMQKRRDWRGRIHIVRADAQSN